MRMQSLHSAQVFRPFQYASEIKTIKTTRPEKGVEALAVGDRGIGGETPGLMTALMREFVPNDLFPQNLSIAARQRKDRELVPVGHGQVVVGARSIVIDRVLSIPHRHRSRDENGFAK